MLQDCDVARLKRERDRYRCDTPEKLRAEEQLCFEKKCGSKPAGEQAQCRADCQKETKLACQRLVETRRYQQRLAELDADITFLEKRGCHPRNVLLVHSGAFLKYIGRLQVTVRQCDRMEKKTVCLQRGARGDCVHEVKRRCTGNSSASNDWEVVSYNYTLIGVDKSLPEDPQMLQLLEPFTLELNRQQLLTQVVGYTPRRIFRFSKGTGDSELGNMVTDAMVERNQVWADFSISNSLGIRSDIIPGPVTAEQMTKVFPFENSITVMYLSGYEVQEMMDFVAQRSASRGCQSQAQVSGLTAVLNCGGCPGDGGNTCLRQTYDGQPCAQRVTIGGSGRPCGKDEDCEKDAHGQLTGEICTNQKHPDPESAKKGKPYRCWKPISCVRNYRLATNDYIAHGGSGFTVLARNTTQVNLKIPMREATKDYIVGLPGCAQVPLTFQERTADPPVQPRIVLDDGDRERLKEMERRALERDLAGADKAFHAVLQTLVIRYRALQQQIKAETDVFKQQKLIAERQGLDNYLGCINESPNGQCTGEYMGCSDAPDKCLEEYLKCVSKPPDPDGQCTGLTCWQVAQCYDYNAVDKNECRILARIRSALRCITLPCIDYKEDGRINRIFRDAAGPPHTDPDYPG
jgi:hypothetical protein